MSFWRYLKDNIRLVLLYFLLTAFLAAMAALSGGDFLTGNGVYAAAAYCIEGELVTVGLVCAADESDPDGGCGCGRAFIGLNSHKATTTAKVKDVELSEEDYVEALRSSLEQQGWPTEDVAELAAWLTELVDSWPTGAIVERRLDDIYLREEASSNL